MARDDERDEGRCAAVGCAEAARFGVTYRGRRSVLHLTVCARHLRDLAPCLGAVDGRGGTGPAPAGGAVIAEPAVATPPGPPAGRVAL